MLGSLPEWYQRALCELGLRDEYDSYQDGQLCICQTHQDFSRYSKYLNSPIFLFICFYNYLF